MHAECEFYASLVFTEVFVLKDAERWFLDVSPTGFRATAQGHRPAWFLMLLNVPLLLSYTHAIIMPSPLLSTTTSLGVSDINVSDPNDNHTTRTNQPTPDTSKQPTW